MKALLINASYGTSMAAVILLSGGMDPLLAVLMALGVTIGTFVVLALAVGVHYVWIARRRMPDAPWWER